MRWGQRIYQRCEFAPVSPIRLGACFIAIATLRRLGTGFFAGLRMTGPDMRLAGDEYYDGTYLSDARVVSTVGLDDNQIDQIRAVKGVAAVMPAYEARCDFRC